MPAAAVIPAPIAYIKVVAVKKLVVEFLAGGQGLFEALFFQAILPGTIGSLQWEICGTGLLL